MFDLLKRQRKILIAIFLWVFSYIVFSVNILGRRPMAWYDRFVVWTISPLQKLSTKSVNAMVDFSTHYVFLSESSKENEKLRRQIVDLKFRNEELIEAAIENERLRKLLLFRDRIVFPHVSAEVVALDLSSQFQMVRINRGQQDGVEKGQPVLGAGGVIGQVFRLSGHYADVLLGTDRNSSIDGVIQRSRARGTIIGAGRKSFKLKFRYLAISDDVQEGDLVVTSGLDGVFPAGLSVGYVSKVSKPELGLFQDAEIQPSVDFSKIQEVFVILKQTRPELSEVLN